MQQTSPGRRNIWLAGLLTFGLLLGSYVTFAQEAPQIIRQSLVTQGDTNPIQLFADDIITWVEGSERAFLLRGRVWIEQGLASLRLQEGVVWVDEDSKQKNGIYNLTLYGEGTPSEPIALDLGSSQHRGTRALIQFATRGEVRVKTYTTKIQQQNLAQEPLFRRALSLRVGKDETDVKTTSLPRPPELQQVPVQNDVVPAIATPANTAAPKPTAYQAEVIPTTEPTQPAGLALEEGAGKGIKQTSRAFTSNPVASSVGQTMIGQFPTAPGLEVPPTLPTPKSIPLTGPPPAEGPERQLNIRPRSTVEMQAIKQLLPNGETAIIIPTGIILTVTSVKEKKVLIDIEADRVVFWTRGGAAADPFGNMRSPEGATSKSMEFFLSGNVEIRNQTSKESQTLRAQEVYYDVGRNVAVAIKGDVEIRSPKTIFPLHFAADELLQLGPKVFQGRRTEAFSTLLPSDPGLKVEIQEATMEEVDTPRTNIFGRPFYDLNTGQPLTTPQRIIRGRNTVLTLEGVPVLWFPYLKTTAEDPLGPLDGLGVNYSRIFGVQVFTTWNIFDLIGVVPQPGLKWQLLADYMSERGPALGTDFRAAGEDLFGIENHYEALIKAYGIYDTGTDILGGDRGTRAYTGPYTYIPITHPDWRGRALARMNVFDLPYGFSFQGQVSAISDRNFLEQFFNQEWNRELNQETFAYLKQQQGIWAWTLLAEQNIRPWITETNWLPKADGYLQGLKIFDLFTYNARADAGYGQLHPANVVPGPYLNTDKQVSTGRFDIFQDISYPFALGDAKIVPYGVLDLAYYTQALDGNSLGRVYGGGGVRGSVPFSRLFPDVQSDLFNLDGIFHKIVFSGNYYYAQSSAHISQLPQLDRLNDDTSDQALRDIYPRQPALNPSNATFLQTNQIVDPQIYALRRLIDNRIDTLDSINVVQLGVRQRWQTKRGFPGSEHVVDWMTLDLQGSIFPQQNRDNFGQLFGVLQYDWLWNIGDRTAIVSNGWMETLDEGPKVFNVGTVFNRPDRSNLYLGYRQIDPLNSKAIVASVSYAFNAKYALTASTLYDFGVNNQTNALILSRIGTDLRVSFGVSYNTILNNFGVILEVVPNLFPNVGRYGGMTGMSQMPATANAVGNPGGQMGGFMGSPAR